MRLARHSEAVETTRPTPQIPGSEKCASLNEIVSLEQVSSPVAQKRKDGSPSGLATLSDLIWLAVEVTMTGRWARCCLICLDS